jgi:hypothetical protein
MDYLLEEVPAESCAGIQRHLEQCAACSEEVGKLRQTLGLLSQAGTMEEVPQRIRLVAEPANRWLAFWRNPARVAFAAAGLACIGIALLALFRTTVLVGNAGVQIAFGVVPQMPTLAVETAPTQAAAMHTPVSREEIARLISEAVARSEARQQTEARLLVENVSQQAEEQRARDWRDMAESLRPLQAAQVSMWKQQVQSQQYVSQLIQQTGLQLPAPQ